MRIRIMHVVDTLGKGGLENGLVNLIQRMSSAEFEHTVYVMRQFGANVDRLPAGRVRLMCLGKKDTDFPIQAAALVRGIQRGAAACCAFAQLVRHRSCPGGTLGRVVRRYS